MPVISSDKFKYFRPEGGVAEARTGRLMGGPRMGGLQVPTGGARAQAQTVSGLAGDVAAWGEKVLQAEVQDQAHRTALSMTKRLNAAEAQVLQSGEPHGNWTDALQRRSKEIREEHRKTVGSEAWKHAEQKFSAIEVSRLRSMQFKSLQESLREQHAGALSEFQDTLELIGEADHAEEVQAFLGDFRSNVEAKVSAGVMDPVEGFRLITQLEDKAGRLKVDQDIVTDPAEALSKLRSEEWQEYYPGLDPTVKPALKDKAQARVKALEREAEQEARKAQAIRVKEFERAFDDHLASIAATGQGLPGLEDMAVEVLGDAEFERFQKATKQAHRKFNVTREIRFMPPAEAAARVEALRPEPGTRGFEDRWEMYSDLRARLHKNLTALVEDPAAYVAGDPNVRSVHDSLAMQSYLGVPEYRQRVMSKAEASETVMQVNALPPRERPAALAQLQEQTGPNFDLAFRQLVDEGLDPSTQIQASVLDDPVALDQISEAAAAGRKQLKESIGDSSLVSATKDAVRAELEDYQETVMSYAWDSQTVKRFNEVQETMTDMALLEVSRGKDENAAARDAVERVVLSKYHPIGGGWFSGPLDHARIPKSVDRDQVEDLAGAVMKTLGEYDLDLPTEDRGRYVKAIKADGYWATLPDDSGLALMYNGAPILTADGDLVSFDFPGRHYAID